MCDRTLKNFYLLTVADVCAETAATAANNNRSTHTHVGIFFLFFNCNIKYHTFGLFLCEIDIRSEIVLCIIER